MRFPPFTSFAMVEQLTADFSKQIIATKGLTVQLHAVQYLSDLEVYAIDGKQFKSYIKAKFCLTAIPRSAVVALTHLQQPHKTKGRGYAPVNISVNGLVISDNFQATASGSVYFTDTIPLIPREHLKVGPNYIAVSSGEDMQTQYWISSLKINLKSKNHILGEANFCQQSILHMGCVKSVTANNQCLYCSSDNLWTMSKGGTKYRPSQ